ncbi:DNA repair protein XRCC2 homolog isoform X2 [Elaeis guineensis]|uniref:DNA repair protein XRCC2 homolog isoform X2 n=1 Tax=Elaeis guineensis var. tenera TaxID=51953 RepID=A0A6J0PER5_ELAGV|nr:DNA repair protein XRCC2 homolog isoform X2 [Elaeis guineensis]
MEENPRGWIHGDETAKAMLSRILTERPFLFLPPLHRVPLRVGNVVEIAGPSPSAKSQILLHAAVNCILPEEWKGIRFGGLGRMVMYFDLDCRFDVLRLSQILKHRIMEAYRSTNNTYWKEKGEHQKNDAPTTHMYLCDDELFLDCMRRFLYIRCYNSFEFLAALKAMHSHSQRESEALGVSVHFLMIDSIGAFYWMDRACQPMPIGGSKRKNVSLQSLAEAVVQEICKLLQMQPVLVLATKATIFGAGTSGNDAQRAFGKWCSEGKMDSRTSSREGEKLMYREYMPSSWQSFVTHRVHLQALDEIISGGEYGTLLTYASQWVQPPLNIKDKFAIRDDGIFLIT